MSLDKGFKYVNICFWLISLFLYLLSPTVYDYLFCLLVFVFFLIHSIYVFKHRGYNNLMSFEFLFVFSFCLSNFIYPVFYYPIDPSVGVFSYYFNHSVISSSTALAYLGFSSFICGLVFTKKPEVKNYLLEYVHPSYVRVLSFLSAFFFIFYIVFGGLKHLTDVYSGAEANINDIGIFSYFYNVFVVCFLLICMLVFRIKNVLFRKKILLFICIITMLILLTGSRTLVVGVGLILGVTYSWYIRPISNFKMICLILFSSLGLSLMMMFRDEAFSLDKYDQYYTSGFDIYLDLIGPNRNLYVLKDFTDSNFNVYIYSALTDIFSPIPGSSEFINSYNPFPKEIMGGDWTTFLEFGPGSSYGLGTSFIGEMYFAFGVYGVIFISYFIGRIIMICKNHLFYNKYAYIIYFLFVSHAIFYPRGFYLFQPRILVWCVLIIYMLGFVLQKDLFIKKKL